MFKLCVLYFLSAAYLNAQMPNDCSGVLVVCDDSTLNLDAQGIGVQEVSGTNNCGSSENNSIWLKLNIQNSGTFGFILTPNSTNIAIDYDFFFTVLMLIVEPLERQSDVQQQIQQWQI